jgi:hypothetical protein
LKFEYLKRWPQVTRGIRELNGTFSEERDVTSSALRSLENSETNEERRMAEKVLHWSQPGGREQAHMEVKNTY